MVSKLLIISKNVRESQYFVDNKLEDTACIFLDSKSTKDEFSNELALLDLAELTNIGIIFDNNCGRVPFVEYSDVELQQIQDNKAEYELKMAERQQKLDALQTRLKESPDDAELLKEQTELLKHIEYNMITIEFINSGKFFSDGFLSVVQGLQQVSRLNTIDIISCNIRHNEQFDNLTGLTVRYSVDRTGKDGDWILESHDVDVVPLYFTDNIKQYPYVLGGVEPSLLAGSTTIYEIDTPAKLYWLMTCTRYWDVGLHCNYSITCDIDMRGFMDIGSTVETPSISIGYRGTFYGNINGNNNTIYISTINTDKYYGFFGSISKGNISNINIVYTTSVTLTNNVTISDYPILKYSGGFCGYINPSDPIIITNCNVTFNEPVTCTDDAAAGFIGFIQNFITIRDCIVNFNKTAEIYGKYHAGSFIGSVRLASITNCTSNCNGITSIKDNSLSTYVNSGGFIGYSTSSIISTCKLNCMNTITIIGGGYSGVGGFIGVNDDIGTLNDCILYAHNIMTIERINDTSAAVGGFCGANTHYNKIKNCSIIACNDININAPISTYLPSGGFCGKSADNSIIEYCTMLVNGNINFNAVSRNTYSFCGQAFINKLINCVSIFNKYNLYHESNILDMTNNSTINCYSITYTYNTYTTGTINIPLFSSIVPNSTPAITYENKICEILEANKNDSDNTTIDYTAWISPLIKLVYNNVPDNTTSHMSNIRDYSTVVSVDTKNLVLSSLGKTPLESGSGTPPPPTAAELAAESATGEATTKKDAAIAATINANSAKDAANNAISNITSATHATVLSKADLADAAAAEADRLAGLATTAASDANSKAGAATTAANTIGNESNSYVTAARAAASATTTAAGNTTTAASNARAAAINARVAAAAARTNYAKDELRASFSAAASVRQELTFENVKMLMSTPLPASVVINDTTPVNVFKENEEVYDLSLGGLCYIMTAAVAEGSVDNNLVIIKLGSSSYELKKVDGIIYFDNNVIQIGDTVQRGYYTFTLLGLGSWWGITQYTFVPTPVILNFNINVQADGHINLAGSSVPVISDDVITASYTIPVTTLYDHANNIGLIELWEPVDNVNTINCKLASENTSESEYKGRDLTNSYSRCAKLLVKEFQKVLLNSFNCNLAEPFNAARYNTSDNVPDPSIFRTQPNFGRLVLSLYADIIFGHITSTIAIANDKNLVQYILSLNNTYKTTDTSNQLYEKWVRTEYDDNASITAWNTTTTPMNATGGTSGGGAKLAVKLVEKLIMKGMSVGPAGNNTMLGNILTYNITPNSSGNIVVKQNDIEVHNTIGDIVKQVVGQDGSRTSDPAGNPAAPGVHQLLRFYSGDIIYISVTVKPPTMTNTDSVNNPAAASSAMLSTTTNKTYVLKITLSA